MNAVNAKNAKAAAKKAVAQKSVEVAAEAKLLAADAEASASAGSSAPLMATFAAAAAEAGAEGASGSSGGGMGSTALILGGIAVAGGVAAAAAGGGGDDVTVEQPKVPTYSVSGNSAPVNEGSNITFTINGTNAEGQTVEYAITGLDAADVKDPSRLTGRVTIVGGKADVVIETVADGATEGNATATITVGGKTASVTLTDSSVLAVPAQRTSALTNGTDVLEANVFNAEQVYTPGGNDRINSLQDEDVLTGAGVNATLNATLGNPGDNGDNLITPTLTGISTVNAAFTASGTPMTLSLEDATGVTSVNVTRVSGIQLAAVQDMDADVTKLMVKDTSVNANVNLTYRDAELDGTQAVALELSNASLDTLVVGGALAASVEQIETINLTVSKASSINDLDLRQDGDVLTGQTLSITANAALVIGEDLDGDGNVIEHGNGLEAAETAGLTRINVSGAGAVTLGEVGSGDDFVLDGSAATGNIAVNISNAAGDEGSVLSTGAGTDTVLVGGALSAVVNTGAGDDVFTVATGGLVSAEDDDGVDEGAKVDLGAGNDTATVVGVVDENSSIVAGDGNDTVTLGARALDLVAGFVPGTNGGLTAGTTAAEDIDALVDLGAGSDALTIINGTINGDVVGGAGTDALTLEAVNNVTVDEETVAAPNNATVTGIETLNLTAAFAYNDASGNDTAQIETDGDDATADFAIDLGAFNADLATINIANQDRATFAANGVDADDGDVIAVALTDYNNEVINITSEETDRNALGTAVAADLLGGAFAADVTLSLTHAVGAASTAVTVNISGDQDSDFALVDGNAAANDIDTLNLVITGAGDHGVDLSNDFDTTLNVTGAGTGQLTIINAIAEAIDVDAHAGDVWIVTADSGVKTISTGVGNDVVDLQADVVTTADALNLGNGTDRIIVDTSLGDVATGDGEIFEGFVSIEELELATGTDAMLDDDAFATGVARVVAQGTSTIRTGLDFERALVVDVAAVNGTTVTFDNDGDNNLTFNVSLEDLALDGAAALDRTLAFTDAGVNNDVVVNVAITGGVQTSIAGANNNVGSDLVLTVAAGSVDRIVLTDSTNQDDNAFTDAQEAALAGLPQAIDNSFARVTVADTWASTSLLIDASAIADNDSARTDLVRSGTTGGVSIDGRLELDAELTILGSANDDIMAGGDEADTLTGNGGNDSYRFTFAEANDSTSQSADTITDFNAGDIIAVDAGTLAGGAQFAVSFASVADLAAGDNSLAGAVGGGAERLGDAFFATGTNQLVIDVNGDGDIQDGIDIVINAAGFTASQLQYTVTAHAGGSTITTGAGNDTVIGGDGVDIIVAGAGDDTIGGAGGADSITGGAGADTMTGGAAADLFTIGNTDSGITLLTADTITDFTAADDFFEMGAAGVDTANTGNYVEVADANFADFAAVLTALNAAAATLAGTSAETELYVFAGDVNGAGAADDIGYLGNDIDGNGTIDQIIVLNGVLSGNITHNNFA